ncbi:MAG: hypothetical protein JWN38_876 [Candidatus Saccharibacteria bacterium]|nr:hypothetical protein [Candidatus Saccharibacteria bacterium]
MAAALGAKLRGGEAIELVSDLGGGKTTFVKGLLKGMGSDELASSPSFTLSNTYQAGELTLQHYDFYRLNDPGILRDELAEAISDDKTVVVIEWADIVADVLDDKHLRVDIAVTGETGRRYSFSCGSSLAYLKP